MAVPAPPPPGVVPDTFRSEGLDPEDGGAADGDPPSTGALGMAAILAIAMAAFAGVRTWVQESGPRRAEAKAHKRELELIAAKANAEAAKSEAGAEAVRAKAAVPSAHEYGRKTLGRASGGSGGGSGSSGPKGPGKPGTATHSPSGGVGVKPGSSKPTSPGASRPGSGGPGGTGPAGKGPGGTGPKWSGTGGKTKPDGSSGKAGQGSGGKAGPGGSSGSGKGSGGTSPGGGSGKGSSGTGSGSGGTGKPGAGKGSSGGNGTGNGGGKTNTPSGTGSSGRTTLPQRVRQAIRDKWFKQTPTPQTPKPQKPKPPANAPQNSTTPPTGSSNPSGTKPGAKPGTTGQSGHGTFWTRTTVWTWTTWTTARGWWKKRPRKGPQNKTPGGQQHPPPPNYPPGGAQQTPPGPGPQWGARQSPFDTPTPGDEPEVVYTVTQDGPARSNRPQQPPPRPPAGAVGPARPGLPRAPQRAAGRRPTTTKPKGPFAMGSAPATVSASGGIPAQHATEINLDQALRALSRLVGEGMDASDDAAGLARQARRLLTALDGMSKDLARVHNVRGPKTTTAMQNLMEIVQRLVKSADRMAKSALDAAEAAEAEEVLMARHYRPVQKATADAGLVTPSAAIHNS
ncbi:hypothetical protein ACGFXC_36950 [Streptomyces sp. NPDC048507]|uniref:hypothetical protein n=1 Tax=Streptomyces sp. NPDC048507 TaxID=3365560 RepID=UPI00371F2C87